MGTARSFSAMLNEYLPNKLLKEELIKRDFVFQNVDKDDSWLGGNLVVPFKGAGASSIASGGLSASTDIASDQFIRGGVASQVEVWGSMIFNHRDLMEHDKVSEQNFLKILPDTVDDFLDYMKNVVSVNLLNGAWFAKSTAASTSSSGLLIVDRPDRFQLGQKVIITATSGTITAYVAAIDMNTLTVTFNTTRAGGTATDFSANNIVSGAKLYNDGFNTSAFTSMRGQLLSAANGGDTNIAGTAKTAYPFLQAINVDGSGCTSSNFVEKIFDGFTTTRRLGKGRPTDIVMSYTNLGYVMKIIEASKGAFNVTPGSQKASQYGWTEIMVGSVTNMQLKFVGVQEMEDDIVMYVDWRAFKFYSNGFFRKRKSPDGIEYFEQRATTGYSYIIDICLFGDLVCLRASYCGIMYGIAIT